MTLGLACLRDLAVSGDAATAPVSLQHVLFPFYVGWKLLVSLGRPPATMGSDGTRARSQNARELDREGAATNRLTNLLISRRDLEDRPSWFAMG